MTKSISEQIISHILNKSIRFKSSINQSVFTDGIDLLSANNKPNGTLIVEDDSLAIIKPNGDEIVAVLKDNKVVFYQKSESTNDRFIQTPPEKSTTLKKHFYITIKSSLVHSLCLSKQGHKTSSSRKAKNIYNLENIAHKASNYATGSTVYNLESKTIGNFDELLESTVNNYDNGNDDSYVYFDPPSSLI